MERSVSSMISSMKVPNYMIENPIRAKYDRLAAFFETFDLTVEVLSPVAPGRRVELVVIGRDGNPESVGLRMKGIEAGACEGQVLAAAAVAFEGGANPLVAALPDRLDIALETAPLLEPVVTAFVREARNDRCGRRVALDRLGEVIVLSMLREAIDAGTTVPGLLAGLSHPLLHRAIVAMHDDPARTWRIEDLAEIAGLSRSRFMDLFPKVVGMTPAAYLNGWRLTLARRGLTRGGSVKTVARRVGFGSAAAFSRAFSRAYGRAPASIKGEAEGTGASARGD